MSLRNRSLRNKFILKATENFSVTVIKAMGCDALDQLDEEQAAKKSICPALLQHSLTLESPPDETNQLPRWVQRVCIASGSADAHITR
ncbi:hypothetical protein P879_04322 [Paragonimus westermani]|uniref:Uncharacterized protein n=1 Tax=Paragonimus westermani TaxID=34504 RepID=A0A8T0DIA9_9TREM|nr:hypothetical protein P879_04322 [Paragonimus westermani]